MLLRGLLKNAQHYLIGAAMVCFGLFNAVAAAQQNGVTLYGIIDLGLEYDHVRQYAYSGGIPQGALNQNFLAWRTASNQGRASVCAATRILAVDLRSISSLKTASTLRKGRLLKVDACLVVGRRWE